MTKKTRTEFLDKIRTINISRRGFVGAAAAAVAARQGLNAAAQDSPEVIYDGEPFDSGGATLRIASWGGFWEELERQYIIDQLEADYNCTVEYDSAWPWFPKFVAGGVDNPFVDVTNWNLPELFKTARSGAANGGYFVPVEELTANVPNSADLWEFSSSNGHGLTYLFSQYGYAYRTDTVDPPPTDFASFWEDRFADKRASYITSNTLQMTFFIFSSIVFGEGEEDLEAGVQAMSDAMPMKISDFTGNMQTLIERGEVDICVQHDGEPFEQIDRGVPIDWIYWTERQPILTQTKTVSKNIDETQKRLAYAYVNMSCSPEYQEAMGAEVYLRPSNQQAVVSENLADKGVENTGTGMDELWIPPWDFYLENEEEIVERVNEIFGQA